MRNEMMIMPINGGLLKKLVNTLISPKIFLAFTILKSYIKTKI